MEEKNSISDSRYKSRFFKKLAAWMGKHGAALTAVVLIAVSAILGCAETTIIYAKKADYSHRQACGVLTAKFSL